jgi:serine/threonine protein kinase
VGDIVGGRFELIDVLDGGGSGTVWRAWDHREKTYVAAKVLRTGDSDSLIRFIREAKRVVQHPHTLAPRNWVGEDDRVLFTMELVRGGSVATLLGDFGALPEGWVIELAGQAADALVAVHAAGFAHRDVKPSNLLLDATGRGRPRLRLGDFGTAAAFDAPRLTMANAVLGTPGYLSPEAYRGADPAPAQDLFALGVVMRQMLAGNEPPESRGRDGLIASDELLALVDEMLADDPMARPASAYEVCNRLQGLTGAGSLEYGADPSDPVEVFDHVPPLPEEWGETGPRTRSVASQPVTPTHHDPDTVVLDREPEPERPEPAEQPGPAPAMPRMVQEHPTPARPDVPTAAWVLLIVGILLVALAIVLA